MANDSFPPREVSALVSLFQRAHNKIVALQKLDDQLAMLAEQHRKLQEEVRGIRSEINEEFERALKSNQAPSKLAAALARPIQEDAPQAQREFEAEPITVETEAETISLAKV